MATLDLGRLVSESMQSINEGERWDKTKDFIKSAPGKAWGGVKAGAGQAARPFKWYGGTMKDQWQKGTKTGKAAAIGMGAAPLLAAGAAGYALKKAKERRKKRRGQ